MKLIDTNGLDFMVKQKMAVSDVFFITPDILDEFEAGHDRKPPRNIENLFETRWFNKAVYLHSYEKMLNSYGGRSFYNMGGFGDISILAALETQRSAAARMLPGLSEEIEVVTGDTGLTKKIKREFILRNDEFARKVTVSTPSKFFKLLSR